MARDFEREWQTGYWDYMNEQAESARYAMVAYYVQATGARSVLDVGCGEGALLGYLGDYDRYLGFDISETAITRARAKYQNERSVFQVADLTGFEPETGIDIVVFNGILYLWNDPDEIGRLIDKYGSCLSAGKHLLLTTFNQTYSISGSIMTLAKPEAEWLKNNRLENNRTLAELAAGQDPLLNKVFAARQERYELIAMNTLINWASHRFPVRHFYLYRKK